MFESDGPPPNMTDVLLRESKTKAHRERTLSDAGGRGLCEAAAWPRAPKIAGKPPETRKR